MSGKGRGKERKENFALTLLVAGIIFIFMLITVLVSGVIGYILIKVQVFSVVNGSDVSPFRVVMLMSITSLVMGIVITGFASKITLKPVNKIITQMNRLASGDFKARLSFNGSVGRHPTVREITDSVNTLAEELENTEMLRSDFINNFSHEFKTPIVSIAGFAKLLKRGDLTHEQRAEYLDIIEQESLRLSTMATNVLYLTKFENQTIVNEVSEFNLSEQIRSSILTLEEKWVRKNIGMNLEFDEYMISADKDMLRHVWMNLIDNAVKFSPENESIGINITEHDNNYEVRISNAGEEIPKDKQKRIFNKFYQADESHASEGNGIGLALVKTVVDLHRGNVSSEYKDGIIMFTVCIPKKQLKGSEE